MNARQESARRRADKVRFHQLPPAIARKLRKSVTRVRRILWARGSLAVLATAVIGILIIMGIDAAAVIYNSTFRWALSLTVLASVVFVAWRALVRPLAKPFTPARIAALIEQRHPELEERLSTVVQLLTAPDDYDRGSEQLLQVLTHAAEADAKDVAPEQEFTTRTVKPKLAAAAVAMAILALLLAAWPKQATLLLARAVAPYAELDNVYADNLLVRPGSQVMLVGEPLEVTAVATGGLSGQAHLRRLNLHQQGRRNEIVERMRQVPSPEGVTGQRNYRLFLPSVSESFRYRVACGHGLTRYYDITAIIRPEVLDVAARYVYPDYTGLEDKIVQSGASEIAAVAGTRVHLTATLSRRDMRATMAVGPDEYPGTITERRTAEWSFPIEPAMNSFWQIDLNDTHGFTNSPTRHLVRAIPDQPPTIVINYPVTPEVTLPPYARLTLEYEVRDDFGAETPELHLGRGDAELEHLRPTPALIEIEQGYWRGSDILDLSTMSLQGINQLRVQLAVADNRPDEYGGPQKVRSTIVVVKIDHQALSLETQTLREQSENIEKTLEEAVERLKEAEKLAEELEEKLEKGEKLEFEDLEKLDEVRRDTAIAEELIKELASETSDTAFDPLQEKLEKLAEEHVTPALESVEETQRANPDDHKEKVAEMEQALEEAVKATEEVLKEMQDFAEKMEQLAALDELAMREDILADMADQEMTPEQMAEWQAMQDALAADLKEQIAEDPSAMFEALESRQEELNSLTEETRQLAQEQEDLRQMTQDLAEPEKRDAAADQIAELTPDAPQEATPEDRAAMAEQQIADKADALETRVEQLAQDLQEFGEQTRPMAEQMREAASDLGEAEDKAEEAVDALEQADQQPPPEATELQQEAKDALDKATGKLETSQRNMQELMDQLETLAEDYDSFFPPEGLNEALESMEQASESAEGAQEDAAEGEPQPAEAMQDAAQAAKDAAEKLQQMTKQMAEQMGVQPENLPSQAMMPAPGEGLALMQQQMRARAQRSQRIPDALKGRLTEDDWFKLMGEVRSGAMDDALSRVPAEYRELVRKYFRELSRQED